MVVTNNQRLYWEHIYSWSRRLISPSPGWMAGVGPRGSCQTFSCQCQPNWADHDNKQAKKDGQHPSIKTSTPINKRFDGDNYPYKQNNPHLFIKTTLQQTKREWEHYQGAENGGKRVGWHWFKIRALMYVAELAILDYNQCRQIV